MYLLCIFLYILSFLCFTICIKRKQNVSKRWQFFIPHINKEGLYNIMDKKIIRVNKNKRFHRNVVCSNRLSEFIDRDININNKMKNIKELKKKHIDNNILIKADIFSNIIEKKNNSNLFFKKFCSFINMEYDETTKDLEELKINKRLKNNNNDNNNNNNNNMYDNKSNNIHNNNNNNSDNLIKCIKKNQDVLQLVEGYWLLTLKNKYMFSFLKKKKKIIFSVSSGVDSLCLLYSFIFVIYKILISMIYKNKSYFGFMNKINSVYSFTHEDIIDIIKEYRYENNVSFFLSILSKIIVIYCHHNTRKECTSEMYFLKNICKKFGIHFKSKKLTEKSIQKLNVINLKTKKKNYESNVNKKININMMKNKKNFLLLARTWRRNIYVHLSNDILKRDMNNNIYHNNKMKDSHNNNNNNDNNNTSMKDPLNMLDAYTYEKYIYDINNYIKITNKKCITNVLIKKESFSKEYSNDSIMRKKKKEGLLFNNIMNLQNNNIKIINNTCSNNIYNMKYTNVFLNKYCILKKKIKSIVFLGHHQNDNNETVLLQFFRGVFLKNLRGIKFLTYYKNCLLYRPFIKLNKLHLYRYMQLINKTWNFDSSNNNMSISRNFIRNVVIPNITHMLKDKSYKNRENHNIDKEINEKNDKHMLDDNVCVDYHDETPLHNKKEMNKYDHVEISKNNIVNKNNELKNQHVYVNTSLDRRLKNVLRQTTNLENYLNYYDNMFFTYLKKKYYKRCMSTTKKITHEEETYTNVHDTHNGNIKNKRNITKIHKSYNTYKNSDINLINRNVHLKKNIKCYNYQDAHNIFMNEYFKMQNNLYNIFFPRYNMETLIKINKKLYEKNIYLKIFNFFELLLLPSKLIRLEILYNIIRKYVKVNIKYAKIERIYEQMIAYINEYIKRDKTKYGTTQSFHQSHIFNDDDTMFDNKMRVQNKSKKENKILNVKIKDLFGDTKIEEVNFVVINITKNINVITNNISVDDNADKIKEKQTLLQSFHNKYDKNKTTFHQSIKHIETFNDQLFSALNNLDHIKMDDNKRDDNIRDDNIRDDNIRDDKKDTHIQHDKDITSQTFFPHNKITIANEKCIKNDEYIDNSLVCFKEKSANIFVHNNISTEVSRLKKYDITKKNDKKNIFLLIKKRKKKKKEKFHIHIRYIKKNDYVYLEKKKISVNKFLTLHKIPYIYQTALPVIEIINFNNNHILFFYLFPEVKSPYFTLREKTFPQKYMNTHFVYSIKFKGIRD
ncbi:hypothetical protein PFFVO_00723 [Plasmodium falciparum Vietnam Oak-Knoll (FVO)]|uniref:tRNA(Ile)-lysidine/2-thiocytidine synthase N-terminal domain-containing protein n=1 Tax=Plasmodium falciparum Vietnam Oak-Knoll (FVO) TaxID=1036723 RepID=A0A024VC65_PLAFA|nr:hypothetical protein PFFVO_00723 [Plasmodium falciparum Vietnam Oak-Knoll (FVO)]